MAGAQAGPTPGHPARKRLVITLAGLPACGFRGILPRRLPRLPTPFGQWHWATFPVTVAGAAVFGADRLGTFPFHPNGSGTSRAHLAYVTVRSQAPLCRNQACSLHWFGL
jgi:hypothetical protein